MDENASQLAIVIVGEKRCSARKYHLCKREE
jgi:hypothetical protein